MTNPLDLSREELAGMLGVLRHPQHRQGIEDRRLTITEVSDRATSTVRVSGTLSGDDPLDDWEVPNPTIRISMPEPPEELAGVPEAPRTTSRVYTLVEVDTDARLVRFDLVRHGEDSPGMRWLAALAIGDRVPITGPRAHRVPGDGTPRILLTDASALPAATRILRTMPHHRQTLIAAVPEEEFALLEADAAGLGGDIVLHRVDPDEASPLATALAGLEPPAAASIWGAGEREDIREVRRICKHVIGLPPGRTQVFGYWKRGTTHTVLDIARLRATQRTLASGGSVSDLDDFEIGL
ncbi:MAG: siderophore-interacting protein [Microbacterium sp.]